MLALRCDTNGGHWNSQIFRSSTMSEDLRDAIEGADLDVVIFLIGAGVNVNRPLPNGQTALNLAIALGLEHIALQLLEAGASVHQSDSFRFDECRRRPVHYAASTGNLKLVKTLMEAGVTIEEQDYSDSTPLHHAAANGHIGLAEWLLAQGSNINHQSKSGRTALWKAAQSGHRHMVHLLKSSGAKLNTQNRVGQTVVFDSIKNSLAITQDIVSAGLDLTLRDIEDNYAMHAAAMLGKTRAIQLFVDHGASVNVKNEYNNSPLHNAAMHNHVTTSLHLLNLGASIDTPNINGQSALYLSMVHKHKEIAELLHLAGARLSKRELNMYKDFEAWKYEEKHLFFLWAWACFNEPLSLMSLARCAVRKSFGDTPPIQGVSRLPLPAVMKKYLLMTDVVTDRIITTGIFPENTESEEDSDCESCDTICDVCEKVVNVQDRCYWYRCTACDDYDLCRACWNTQAHLQHRGQMHKFVYFSDQKRHSLDCQSCGALASHIADNENFVFWCTACEHFVMCQLCRQDGMHRKHRDHLRVQTVIGS